MVSKQQQLTQNSCNILYKIIAPVLKHGKKFTIIPTQNTSHDIFHYTEAVEEYILMAHCVVVSGAFGAVKSRSRRYITRSGVIYISGPDIDDGMSPVGNY